MGRVHVDFLGPLPRTPRGKEHVLVMVDQFTKYVPNQSAEVTAKAAVGGFFSRFGMSLGLLQNKAGILSQRLREL